MSQTKQSGCVIMKVTIQNQLDECTSQFRYTPQLMISTDPTLEK